MLRWTKQNDKMYTADYRGISLAVFREYLGWKAEGQEGSFPSEIIGRFDRLEQAQAGAERWAKRNYGESQQSGRERGKEYQNIIGLKRGDYVEVTARYYDQADSGLQGQVIKAWIAPNGNEWATVHFGKNAGGQNLRRKYPANTLKKITRPTGANAERLRAGLARSRESVSPRFRRVLESELRRLIEQYGRSSLDRPPSAGMTEKQLRRKDTLAAYKEYPKLKAAVDREDWAQASRIIKNITGYIKGWSDKQLGDQYTRRRLDFMIAAINSKNAEKAHGGIDDLGASLYTVMMLP